MKPKPEYDDPGLRLTPFGRKALLIGIIIGLAIAIAIALTDHAGAAPLTSTSAQPLASICQKGVVTDFQTVPGGHVVSVVRTGHALADSYWTTRTFYRTQRVTVCAGIVK
jgi:hypothetical protein